MDNTTWLESQHMIVAMKILYETKLQHKDINFINIQYVNKKVPKKKLSNISIWILTIGF
jgi:hypothetical protein